MATKKRTVEEVLEGLNAQESYSTLQTDSADFMTLATACSELTTPNFVYDGDDVAVSAESGLFTNAGTQGLEKLISDLITVLFPPGKSFYYLTPTQEISDEATAQSGEEGRTLIEKELMKPITYTNRIFDSMRLREDLHKGLKVAAMGGGSLLKLDFENSKKCQAFTLNNYRCKENPLTKEILEFVTREVATYGSLDKEILENLELDGEIKDEETVEIYTHGYYITELEKYVVYQQIENQRIEASVVEYDKEVLPFIHIVINPVNNTSYGLGLVSPAYYDLNNLNKLYKNLIDQSAMNSTVRWMLDPSGTTRIQDILNSKNGDILRGKATDLQATAPPAQAQQNLTLMSIQHLEMSIEKYFMTKNVDYGNRDRVTSTEIMNNANAIDAGKGGLFSALSARIQYPLSKLLLSFAGADSNMFEGTEIRVVTGLQAINQGQEAASLDSFINSMAVMAQYKQDAFNAIDLNEYTKRVAVANQIDPSGLIKSQQQMQQEQVAAQKQQLAMQGASGAVDAAVNADAAAMEQAAMEQQQQQQ